ncbi:hypothetical protein C8Q74DRAFT_1311173 [Fomes fomentarius]|nr:hypothetical protein C8Q74DRAFT_1311173 [Fomes fomentarius]
MSMNLIPECQASVSASSLDDVLHIEKADMDRRALCAFKFAMKSPKEEWRTYGFISELLFMFALAMSTPTTTIGLVPQFNLIPNKAIPDFGAYVQRVDVSPSMGLVWEAKPLSGLNNWQGPRLSVSKFWKKATFLAKASLTSYYDSIEAYAEKSFRESSPPVLPEQHLFICFSSGPVFSVFEFTRNEYFKKWTLDPEYAKHVLTERRRLAPKVHYLFQPIDLVPQILAAMHLPYKDLNLSSKVPWFHPVTPMETGADKGLQFVMEHTAKKFKEDIKNYLGGEKTQVPSDKANESEYVPKGERQRLKPEENPSRPPHGTATATVFSVTSDIIPAVTTAPSISPTVTTTATSETVQSLAPTLAPMSSSTIHPHAPNHSSSRARFKTTPPTELHGSAGGVASTDLMGTVVDSGQPPDAQPPARKSGKRKGRLSDLKAADLEADAPKKRARANAPKKQARAKGHDKAGEVASVAPGWSNFVDDLDDDESEPLVAPSIPSAPPFADDTVHAPAPSAPQAVLSTASTTVTVSGSDTIAVEDAPAPDVSQSHPSVSQPQADHLPVAHDQSPEPEGTAPSVAVQKLVRDGCDLDAGTLADLEGSDTDNATGTSSRVRRKTVQSITWIYRPQDLIADLIADLPLLPLESGTDPELQKKPAIRLGGPRTRQVTKMGQITKEQHANVIATLPKPGIVLQVHEATNSKSNDSRNKRRQPQAGPSGERRERGSERAVEGDEDEDEDEDDDDDDEVDEDAVDEDLDDEDDEVEDDEEEDDEEEDDNEDNDDEDNDDEDDQDEYSGDEEDQDVQ